MSLLFTPLKLRNVTIPNRAWVSPMCQYSVDARDGVPTDWQLVHLGAFAQGGFGLIVTEATAVAPEGRISPYDLGIWNDEQAAALRRINDFCHSQGSLMAIQLAHAGRKASTDRWFPGAKGGPLAAEEGGWDVIGPSAISFDGYDNPPCEMTEQDIQGVINAFRDAALRSKDAGFDVIEIHAAHGYLLHQFYSPLSNQRQDAWGGDFDGRTRLVREVARAIREVWTGPLFVRISATDWVDGGWTIEDSVRLATLLKEDGADLIDTSSGGNAHADIPAGEGYQVPFAEQIRRDAEIATGAVGMITEPAYAEGVLENGQADAIFLGRVALREPHWPQRAAHELGIGKDDAPYAPQHYRGAWPRQSRTS